MNPDRERPSGYYACLILMLLPIVGILLLQLPYALLMIAFVVIPLLGCGLDFKGSPLFQSPYHGEPFIDEVMNIHENERIA